ncbi:cytochrome P450 [Aspergillus varians]
MVACAVALVLSLVAGTVLHLFYNYSRLNTIPGPSFAAMSDFWRLNAQRSSEYGRRLAQLHRKHGDVVRLGPGHVSVANARDIARIYRIRIEDELSRCGLEGQLPEHQEASQYVNSIDDALRNLVRTIQQHITIDLTTSLRFFANEFMSASLISPRYAESYGPSRTQPSSWLFATVEEMLLRSPAHLKRERFLCCNLSGDASAPTYANNPVLPQGISTDAGPDSHASSVLAASIETITRTFVAVFFFLLQQPRILHRLRNEIDSMPRFWNRATMPYASDYTGIFYLDVVLKEATRLVLLRSHPRGIRLATGTINLSTPHRNLPRGTVVSWLPSLVLANQSIYGTDPDRFRPERWLAANRHQRDLMEESLLPFMVCMDHYPDLEAAWFQLKNAVVVLLREFDDIQLLQTAEQDSGPYPPSMLVELRPRISTGRGYFGQLV